MINLNACECDSLLLFSNDNKTSALLCFYHFIYNLTVCQEDWVVAVYVCLLLSYKTLFIYLDIPIQEYLQIHKQTNSVK